MKASIAVMGGDGIELTGKDVADVGSGDGIIDLGVYERAKPARLVVRMFNISPSKAGRPTKDCNPIGSMWISCLCH